MATLHIAMAQINVTVGDIRGNVQRIIAAIGHARDVLHADVVVFPELVVTGYPPEDLILRPAFLRAVENALRELLPQVQGIAAIIGHPGCEEGAIYNSASVIENGEVKAVYHKQRLPNHNVFDEKRYFHSGDEPCVVSLCDVNIGLLICEDVWTAEPVKGVAEAGAQLMLVLNASPYHCGKVAERHQVVADRARENAVPVIYVNLVGGQDELVFDGESFVVDAEGHVTQQLPAFEEAVELVKLDVAESGVIAQTVSPLPCVLPDAGAGVWAEEATIYQALVLGVRDYIEKNHFKGVVLGLSGGIDSALTLAIAVDAIGAERVEAVMMPSRYTLDMSNDDAQKQADVLGVRHQVIPIEPAFKAFLALLEDEFQGTEVDVTEENIQARCRGVILMAISNKKHKILLTTGNKSEMAVGYCTLYGDMAGGFAPIKDLTKTRVYNLSRYRNSLGTEPVIPLRVIERPPSAELAEDQKDEDSLPPYDVLDRILEQYIECDRSPEDIVAQGFDADIVDKIVRMVNRNEYKRRQAPPGVRITQRAFGRDRRYPITSGFSGT